MLQKLNYAFRFRQFLKENCSKMEILLAKYFHYTNMNNNDATLLAVLEVR